MLVEEPKREEYAEIYGEDEGYSCPRCGAKCGSLTEFHRHWERKHGGRSGLK